MISSHYSPRKLRAADIASLRKASSDYTKTEEIKADLRRLRDERRPFYLTGEDLEPIFRWKLVNQYGRQKAARKRNSEQAYRVITRAAFEIHEKDPDDELELRINLLTALRGVGIPVASAILALAAPDRYCVIDFRGWRAMYGEDKRSFSLTDYRRYLHDIRALANELGWPPQEVDLAVWVYDKQHAPRQKK